MKRVEIIRNEGTWYVIAEGGVQVVEGYHPTYCGIPSEVEDAIKAALGVGEDEEEDAGECRHPADRVRVRKDGARFCFVCKALYNVPVPRP